MDFEFLEKISKDDAHALLGRFLEVESPGVKETAKQYDEKLRHRT